MRWVVWLALVAITTLGSVGCETFDPKHPLVGKPTDFEGVPAVYVWIADGLWHVRLHAGGRGGHRFQGSVAGVNGGVLDLTLTKPELKDAIALAGDAVQFDVEEPAMAATAVAFTARAIADSYRRFLLPRGPIDDVRVAGGGAHNATLMAELRRQLHPIPVAKFAESGVDADAKEAVAFALLAVQCVHADVGNVPSVTGAKQPAVLGKICLPPVTRATVL